MAHAKVILFGEHSVVHGEPAIALPIDALGIHATARRVPGALRIVTSLYTGPLAQAPDILKAPRVVVEATLAELGLPQRDIEVTVSGDVPHARGLGSSAAVAGALVRALADFAEIPLDEETYLRLVDVGERVAHGAPSGLDARATSATDPVTITSITDARARTELGGNYVWVRPDSAQLAELGQLVLDGIVRVEIAQTFPLEQAADAHRAVETGHVRGKVVVTID